MYQQLVVKMIECKQDVVLLICVFKHLSFVKKTMDDVTLTSLVPFKTAMYLIRRLMILTSLFTEALTLSDTATLGH